MKKAKQRKKDEVIIDVTRHSGREPTPRERLIINLSKTKRTLETVNLEKIELEKKLTSSREGLKCLERRINLRKAFLLDQVAEMDSLIDMIQGLIKTCEEKTEE